MRKMVFNYPFFCFSPRQNLFFICLKFIFSMRIDGHNHILLILSDTWPSPTPTPLGKNIIMPKIWANSVTVNSNEQTAYRLLLMSMNFELINRNVTSVAILLISVLICVVLNI